MKCGRVIDEVCVSYIPVRGKMLSFECKDCRLSYDVIVEAEDLDEEDRQNLQNSLMSRIQQVEEDNKRLGIENKPGEEDGPDISSN